MAGAAGRAATLVAHDEAAVDVNRLAGHVVRVAAGEEAHHAGDVVGLLGAAEWNAGDAALPGFADFPAFELGPFGIDPGPQWRIDDTRADAVGRDLERCQHLRRGAGNADHAGFAGRVMHHIRLPATVRRDRGGLNEL